MASIDAWSLSNRAEDWEAIIRTARNIQTRQDRIEPLLPLVSENGYRAKFTFVDTEKIINEAKDKVVSLYETRLIDLVKAAPAMMGQRAQRRQGSCSQQGTAFQHRHLHLLEVGDPTATGDHGQPDQG